MKGTRAKVHTAILTTMLIAIPAAVGIGVLANPVVSFLFPGQTSLDLAADLLRALSVTVVFYSLSTLTNAVLQGIGKVNVPVINAFVALIVQTVVLVPCLWYTDLNLYSLAIAAIVYSLLMCILNGISVKKHLGYKQDIKKVFLLPAAASVVMGVAAYGVYTGLYAVIKNNVIALLPAIVVGAAVYGILILKMGVLTEDDILAMPKGKKLAGILEKLHMISRT